MLRKLRPRQKNGFLIKKKKRVYIFLLYRTYWNIFGLLQELSVSVVT